MNNLPKTNKSNCDFEDDEVFDDSSFLAKFDSTSVKESRFSEINDSHNKSDLNVSALCCDEEISGYDKLTGKTWIYPTNYPVRDYQFNIIKASLLKNTLVSLPTGLGKTFIAAVIMYNFYRWYPLGKIVFTAPTRPLVAQQIEACYHIIAIPPNDTIEMTGHMHVNTRKQHWQNKRVFFATPQVIYNDIKSGICPGEKIRCLVIDEAHRARGNYAYCQIMSTLTEMGHKTYRILALSATPGSKVDDVISVVKSLHISHLELRAENCIDVAPYSHSRKINTVIVPLGPELTQLRQQYVEILDSYARRLKQFNILPQNLGNLSKGRIVMLYKEFQTKDRSARHPQHSYIMKDFTILIALYHGLELLVKHGSRVFLNFFDEHPEKSWIQADDRLTVLLERLRDDLGINPLALDRSILPDGTIPDMPKDLCFGHPKFYRLKEIMMEHFTRAKKNGQDTRAIVFCEYRESVNLVHCLLLQCRPLITPQMFVGQGASGKDGKAVVSQKQQLRVMRAFREGACNALVATCVAEEGLDVGSVDLILCFDISSRSPVRLVQRCGRTGRERGGQVHILVTEGREHQTLLDCMRQRDGLNQKILQSKEVENNLYKQNPRMVPRDFTPQCQKMFIAIAKKDDPKSKDKEADKAKKGQKDLRTMLLAKPSTSDSRTPSKDTTPLELITENEFQEMFTDGFALKDTEKAPQELWAMSKERIKSLSMESQQTLSKWSTWLEWQRTLQKTVNIGHSKDSEILASLLQYSDAKRFEMPASTQNPTFNTQDIATQNIMPSPVKAKPKQKKKIVATKSPMKKINKSPAKKDGDIRALFSTNTKSTTSYTKLINDLGVPNDGSIPTRLINLLVDLNLENSNTEKECYICQNICDCNLMLNLRKHRKKPNFPLKFITDPQLPDLDLIDEFDVETVLKCAKNDTIMNLDEDMDLPPISLRNNIDLNETNIGTLHNQSIKSNDKHNSSNNFDLEFDFGSPNSVCIIEKTPEKIKDVAENNNNNFDLEFDFDSLDNFNTPVTQEQPEKVKLDTVEIKPEKIVVKEDLDKNFEIGDIEDIFAESSPEEVAPQPSQVKEEEKCEQPKEALGFFGLDSIDDIFADYDDSIEVKPDGDSKATTNDKSQVIKLEDEKPNLFDVNRNGVKSDSNVVKPYESKHEVEPPRTSEYPVSPSILSGRQRNNIPSSPILCTQKRRFQLSTRKGMSSTPASNARRQLIKSPGDVSTVVNESKTNVLQESNDKSMFTITQLIQMINNPDDKSKCNQSSFMKTNNDVNIRNDEERSTSPILLTQADRKKANNATDTKITTTQTNKSVSLIVLDSDSDSCNETQEYELDEEIKIGASTKNETTTASPVNSKRKLDVEDDFISASPYFNKKPKLDNNKSKPLTLQEKVLAALKSNKTDIPNNSNDRIVNFSFSPRKAFSQKENKDPQVLNGSQCGSDDEKEYVRKSNLEMLQIFRRDSKIQSPKDKFNLITLNTNGVTKSQKRKLTFDDSDDDFVDADKSSRNQKPVNGVDSKSSANYKKRKKKKQKQSSFLDLEAELSDSASGDELSDSSAGSIVDFICDDNDVTHHVDMQAHYMRSVKSPVKGVFKIPELPKKYNNMEVFSQYVEEDNYEMDSFCVDSHIGLTQVNDEISELELAEIVLEEKRRKKKPKSQNNEDNGDSPIVRRKNKNARQIQSDSDDSS
ncbi:uncharacterized protein LOC114361855 [Ostrinia furnacalis]|uniref:uncharacterized protein LOC114361855 n=1 Tax=Ostrinia furnacalis TaxID=93504 RepID=UPI001039A685|nr:uncharacterized protein LOC114361855 [Ostrinia furnacalis]